MHMDGIPSIADEGEDQNMASFLHPDLKIPLLVCDHTGSGPGPVDVGSGKAPDLPAISFQDPSPDQLFRQAGRWFNFNTESVILHGPVKTAGRKGIVNRVGCQVFFRIMPHTCQCILQPVKIQFTIVLHLEDLGGAVPFG